MDAATGGDNIIIINYDEMVVNEKKDAVEYQLNESAEGARQ